MVLWASNRGGPILAYFEAVYPGDARPRKAAEAAWAWVRDEITLSKARAAAFDAHAAARDANSSATRAAARAAVHVARHARHDGAYALAAAEHAGITGEREWQLQHLPQQLNPLAFPAPFSG